MSTKTEDRRGLGHCLSDLELERYLAAEPDGGDRAEVEDHLSRCSDCRLRFVQISGHCDFEDVDREPVDAIPSEIMAKVRALPFSEPGVPSSHSGSRFRISALAASLLIATLGWAIWLRAPSVSLGPDRSDEPVFRTGSSAADPGLVLELASPQDGETADPHALDLRWRALAGADRYTVTVLEPLGGILHRETTREPTLRPTLDPSRIQASSQSACFWFVVAHLEDGSSVESEIRDIFWQPSRD